MEEKNEQTTLNITPAGDRLEIRHLHGEAPAQFNPVEVNISGSIETPGEYFEKRLAQERIDVRAAYVEVQENAGAITLYPDPTSPIGGVIHGKLAMNPVLKRLRINNFGRDKFSEEEFIMAMKEARSLFPEQSECLALIDKIRNLELKVNQKINKANDDRGNRKHVFEQVAKSELPDMFTLSTFIFIGSKDATQFHEFTVELKYHYSSGGLGLWLESPDLQEIIDSVREEMIGEQILRFGDQIPIIYK